MPSKAILTEKQAIVESLSEKLKNAAAGAAEALVVTTPESIAGIVRPVKKKNRGSPPPSVRRGFGENAEDKILVTRLLSEAFDAYSQPKVKSDEELAERLNTYFKHCAETGQIPTVEEMAHYTGYTQSTVWDWEVGRNKGFSSQTAEIIKRAKEYLKTFDAKLVVSGKVNPIVYFFRAKNYYGLVDKQEIAISPNTMMPLFSPPP